MPRGIVYPARRVGGRLASQHEEQPPDGYGEKIAKYVPAEVLGAFIPLTAQAAPHGKSWIIGCFVAGLIATPLYFFISSRRKIGEHQKRWYAYVFATLAFVAWAVGTNDLIEKLFNMDGKGSLILGLTVFLLPAIDETLTKLLQSGS